MLDGSGATVLPADRHDCHGGSKMRRVKASGVLLVPDWLGATWWPGEKSLETRGWVLRQDGVRKIRGGNRVERPIRVERSIPGTPYSRNARFGLNARFPAEIFRTLPGA
jgi:hypothetical protein